MRVLLAVLMLALPASGQEREAAFDLARRTAPDRAADTVPADERDAGLRAAREWLETVRTEPVDPRRHAEALGLLGMHLLAAREFEAARAAFLAARDLALAADEPAAARYHEASGLLALVLAGAGGPAAAADFREALAAVDRDGAGDGLRRVRDLLGAPSPDRDAWRRERIEAGPLVLEVCLSRTASLFRMVDQLSAWDSRVLPHWRKAFPLSEEDEVALAKYAAVRREKGWGGLEPFLLTDLDLDSALFEAVSREALAPEQAMTVREAFERFRERSEKLGRESAGALDRFVRRLDPAALRPLAEALLRLSGGEPLTIPVFPVATPDGGAGGGMNGGRMVVEVPRAEDVSFILLHEVAHAFLSRRKAEIAAAAGRAPGLDEETLTEAVVYAIAPGLFHPGREGDPLADRAAEHRARGEGMRDGPPSARFRLLALAIRPAAAAALADGRLDPLLDAAGAAWAAAEGR